MRTIGFIGAGNMGGAMAKACAKVNGGNVWIYDVNPSIYAHFEVSEVMHIAATVDELMKQCQIVVLSVKPQFYEEVCQDIKDKISEDQIVVTVAPSYDLASLKMLLGNVKLIRTMPNTPALIGEGVTAYCYEEGSVGKGDIEAFEMYFSSFGKLVLVKEHLMPAVVATSGSSPAYGYMFIEAMADAAVSMGMPRNVAYEMAAMSIKGACEMILQTGKHPGQLKDAVTSPAGTTIKAVLAMEEAGFRNSVIKGMEACYRQVVEMSKR